MDMQTWSPFQSEETKQICAHMTRREKTKAAFSGAFYGVWCALTFAIPFTFLVIGKDSSFAIVYAGLIALHLICIPIWQKWIRHSLCQTEWAKAKEIDPKQLTLYSWRFGYPKKPSA